MAAVAPDLFFAAGDCLTRLGVLSQRTSPGEEAPETHTRAGTNTYTDRNGDSKTADANVITVHWLDDDSDGVYDTQTLKLGTSDTIYWPWPWKAQAMTLLVDFDMTSLMSASAAVVHIGSATAATDPRLVVISNGTYFQAIHDNGSTTATATLAAAPSQNDRVELMLTLASDGSLTLEQSVNQGASTTASDATTVTLTAWADSRIYLNSAGSSSAGSGYYRAVKAARGSLTLAEMRAL